MTPASQRESCERVARSLGYGPTGCDRGVVGSPLEVQVPQSAQREGCWGLISLFTVLHSALPEARASFGFSILSVNIPLILVTVGYLGFSHADQRHPDGYRFFFPASPSRSLASDYLSRLEPPLSSAPGQSPVLS